jgi:DnaJ-domain-containing protein 1
MGQLFNRFSRYIKSEIDDYEVTSHKNADDSNEDLKRIINELNSEKINNEKKADASNNSRKSKEEKKVFTLDEAYLILDLKSDATVDEIKSSYKQKMKEYHPDRVANLGIELKQLAEQKTQEINRAYELLKKYRGFN